MPPILTPCWYAAGADTTVNHYERLTSDEFKKSDKYLHNKFIDNMPPFLISFGTNIAKPSIARSGDRLYASNKKLINNIYKNYHKKNQPFLIDSGGFLLSIGKVPKQYIPNMINYYVKYIKETCEDPIYDDMLYFYLDIVPIAGLTDKDSLEFMTEFHNTLKDEVGKIPGALDKMIIVLQCSTEQAYKVFHKFVFDTVINDIHSHRYSQGSLVPLIFSKYKISPWIVGLLDVLELEKDNLTKNQIQFHLLGTSSVPEMILISWLTTLFNSRGIDIVITFDSTAAINNASRSGIMHCVDYDENVHSIVEFCTKYGTITKEVDGRYTHKYSHIRNIDYLNKCWNDLKKHIDVRDENDPLFDKKGRWTPLANTFFGIYETYAYAQMYSYIDDMFKNYKEYIIDTDKSCGLKRKVYEVLDCFDGDYKVNKSKLDSTVNRLLNSLEYVRCALDNKLDPFNRSFSLVKTLFKNNVKLVNRAGFDVANDALLFGKNKE